DERRVGKWEHQRYLHAHAEGRRDRGASAMDEWAWRGRVRRGSVQVEGCAHQRPRARVSRQPRAAVLTRARSLSSAPINPEGCRPKTPLPRTTDGRRKLLFVKTRRVNS